MSRNSDDHGNRRFQGGIVESKTNRMVLLLKMGGAPEGLKAYILPRQLNLNSLKVKTH